MISSFPIVGVMRSRWRGLSAVWLGTMALAAAVTAALPAQYRATASVAVEPKISDPIAGIALPGGLISNQVATQVDIVQSERVALRAVRALNLQSDEKWLARWKKSTHERGSLDSWLAGELLAKLDVRPSRDSNVISLTYRSSDPAFSASAVNALVQAYIETSLDMRMEPARQYNRFFDERAKRLRDALEQAQAQLSAFQQKHGLVATEEKLDVENERLNGLSAQLALAQAGAAEASGRQRQAALQPEQSREVLGDQTVIALTAELSRQEAKLSELKVRVGDQHPHFVEARSAAAELRERLQSAVARAAGSLAQTRKASQSQLQDLNAALDAQRAKVLRMKGQRDEAQVLLRDVENAQRAYDAVLGRASQTALESRDTQPNVSVLKVATPPPLPWFPKWWLIMAAAASLGACLGVGFVSLLEMRDRRLRSPQDVEKWLQVPLLTVVPRRRAASPA